MKTPQSRKELESQLGMFTYLAQYSPQLSDKTVILRELVRKDNQWDNKRVTCCVIDEAYLVQELGEVFGTDLRKLSQLTAIFPSAHMHRIRNE